jgi:glycosyltransferase involved in cell wall biosynthesis
LRVALDAQLTVGTATGIGEYVRGLAAALRGRDVDVVELRDPRYDPWRFDRRALWDQIVLPRRARASGAALLHCAAGTMPAAAAMPIVVTVHDLAWHRVQAHAPAYARYYFGAFSFRRYRRAAAILVDSDFTRGELLALAPDLDEARVRVVYPGVADDFCRLERGDGDRTTILAVGTVERRKNLEVLVRALAQLARARLIAIGPLTPYARECEVLARELGVGERVEIRGYVAREELLALYRRCAVAAVPSVYEGFGYAVAQALCAGVPCVVSERSSLPEIAGGDARIADAADPGAWAAALARAMQGEDDESARGSRDAAIARFSWETSARGVERAYAESINR